MDVVGEEQDELTNHAMDVALTLHAEHEFNASSFAAQSLERISTCTRACRGVGGD